MFQAFFEGLGNSVVGTERDQRYIDNTQHILTGTFLPLRTTASSVSEKTRLLDCFAALK
jgi:hypothetical protein